VAAAERLGEVADQLDAERFVGRTRTLTLIADGVSGASRTRVFHVHGPGGVGKSALLRAVERQARASERTVVHLDGRLIAPTPDGLAGEVARAADADLLIIDEADELIPLRFELRQLVRTAIPASTVVVLAGRAAPGREWFDEGLDQVSADIVVRPLDNTEGRDLLGRYGVTESTDVDQILTWASGYPLALTVGANLLGAPPEPTPSNGRMGAAAKGDGLDDLILARLGGREIADVDPDVLDVACVAPAVDARLLAAVLPGRPTRSGLAQLRALSVSEQLGSRTTLHRLVRSALRSRLKESDPDRYRTVVLRVAGHLHQRALTENPMIALELASLIENPDVRLGFDASTSHYADFPRPGDIEELAAFCQAADTAWFARFRRWCEEQPRQAIAVRRATGELAAMSVICMASEMPAWADDDIETGPLLRYVRANGQFDEVAHMHDTIILEDPSDTAACAEVIRVGNAGAMAGAIGTRNPRYMYVTAASWNAFDGTQPLGYQEVTELRRSDDERELQTIMADFGPEGVPGQMYALVLAEQQAEAPASTTNPLGSALLGAVRSFHDDAALAAGPLAPPDGTEPAKAAAVRAQVEDALVVSFGESEQDQRLRQAIERTYLDPDGGHGIAQRELHMSRSSFYRHLQKARQQLVDRAGAT
jgi:hypothetical protein